MRKAMKETTKKESAKKEKKACVRPEVPAKPSIGAAPLVVIPEPADAEVPVWIPPDGESADTPASDTAPETGPVVPADVPAESPADAEPPVDLDALRKSVEEAKAALKTAMVEMRQLVEHARVVVMVARDDYLKALAPYREACRKAGRPCEFEGGRAAYVSERVSFLVERDEDGVRIMIRGRPETEEKVPLAELEKSVSRAAYAYTGRHLGTREEIGNKGGGLGNRIRALMK